MGFGAGFGAGLRSEHSLDGLELRLLLLLLPRLLRHGRLLAGRWSSCSPCIGDGKAPGTSSLGSGKVGSVGGSILSYCMFSA